MADELASLVTLVDRRLSHVASSSLDALERLHAGPRRAVESVTAEARADLSAARRALEDLSLLLDELDPVLSGDQRTAYAHALHELQDRLRKTTGEYRQAAIGACRRADAAAASGESALSAQDVVPGEKEVEPPSGSAGPPASQPPRSNGAVSPPWRSPAASKPTTTTTDDDALMSTTSRVTDGLRRTMQLMQEQLAQSAINTESLVTQTQTMQMTSGEYTSLSNLLSSSKSLLRALERADVLDRLLIFLALAFFALSCAWVVKRRVLDKGVRVAKAAAKVMGAAGAASSTSGTAGATTTRGVVAPPLEALGKAITQEVAEAAAAVTASLTSIAAAITTASQPLRSSSSLTAYSSAPSSAPASTPRTQATRNPYARHQHAKHGRQPTPRSPLPSTTSSASATASFSDPPLVSVALSSASEIASAAVSSASEIISQVILETASATDADLTSAAEESGSSADSRPPSPTFSSSTTATWSVEPSSPSAGTTSSTPDPMPTSSSEPALSSSSRDSTPTPSTVAAKPDDAIVAEELYEYPDSPTSEITSSASAQPTVESPTASAASSPSVASASEPIEPASASPEEAVEHELEVEMASVTAEESATAGESATAAPDEPASPSESILSSPSPAEPSSSEPPASSVPTTSETPEPTASPISTASADKIFTPQPPRPLPVPDVDSEAAFEAGFSTPVAAEATHVVEQDPPAETIACDVGNEAAPAPPPMADSLDGSERVEEAREEPAQVEEAPAPEPEHEVDSQPHREETAAFKPRVLHPTHLTASRSAPRPTSATAHSRDEL